MAGYSVRDNAHKVTKALPNGAAATTSDAIDLGLTARSDFTAPCELLITAPALGATPLPDAKTMKYDILMSDQSNLGTPTTLVAAAITQTGASSAGAVGAEYRFRLPTGVKRYIGVKATGSGSGDASGSSFTAELLF